MFRFLDVKSDFPQPTDAGHAGSQVLLLSRSSIRNYWTAGQDTRVGLFVKNLASALQASRLLFFCFQFIGQDKDFSFA